jgi:hypothetical protein
MAPCAAFAPSAARRNSKINGASTQDAKHAFAKVMFNLPIPRFDAKDQTHLALAKAAGKAEKIAAAVELPEGVKFQRARKLVRDALVDAGVAAEIDALVARLLDPS